MTEGVEGYIVCNPNPPSVQIRKLKDAKQYGIIQ